MDALLLLPGRVIVEFLFITLIARFGKHWLYGSILVNLLLVTVLGAKTIAVLGFEMNSGNVFYAGVLYAVYLLIELYGKEAAEKAIWPMVALGTFFILMTELVINTPGAATTREFDQAMRTILSTLPRVGIASMLAFALSQHVNIALYDGLRKRTKGAMVWFRNIVSVIVTQAVDSVIFFSIAFMTLAPSATWIEIMLAGFVVKVIVGILSTPFLYLSLLLSKE